MNEVLMAVTMQNTVFWHATQYTLKLTNVSEKPAASNLRIKDRNSRFLQNVNFYQITECHTSKGSNNKYYITCTKCVAVFHF
jgi:hypothetical protein